MLASIAVAGAAAAGTTAASTCTLAAPDPPQSVVAAGSSTARVVGRVNFHCGYKTGGYKASLVVTVSLQREDGGSWTGLRTESRYFYEADIRRHTHLNTGGQCSVPAASYRITAKIVHHEPGKPTQTVSRTSPTQEVDCPAG